MNVGTQRIHWAHGISWTMWRRAFECGKQAELAIAERNGVPRFEQGTGWPTYYADVGTIVQKFYECYFNQGVNLRPGGTNSAAIATGVNKVLASPWCAKVLEKTTYPEGKDGVSLTVVDLVERVRKQALSGLRGLADAGVLDRPVRSEVASVGLVRGLPIFALIDFLVELPHGDMIFDGKSNANRDADPRQMYWCALTRAFNKERSRNVVGGGFIYWIHGFEPVRMNGEDLQRFIDGDFKRILPVFERLRTTGVDEIPAQPKDYKVCKFCAWSGSCSRSLAKPKREPDFGLPERVGFDDV